MTSYFGGIMSLVLSVVLITSVVVPTIKNANTTGWSTSETTVFGLVSLVAIFGLVYGAGNLFGLF